MLRLYGYYLFHKVIAAGIEVRVEIQLFNSASVFILTTQKISFSELQNTKKGAILEVVSHPEM
ncbi:MAG: hypothetical protein EA390_10780 [Balneolaceae bacterium]|nr:MAG: hypothetical protein EA390_10780 [Balneolaceae bacterium]